jgi:hypothetical protein
MAVFLEVGKNQAQFFLSGLSDKRIGDMADFWQ